MSTIEHEEETFSHEELAHRLRFQEKLARNSSLVTRILQKRQDRVIAKLRDAMYDDLTEEDWGLIGLASKEEFEIMPLEEVLDFLDNVPPASESKYSSRYNSASSTPRRLSPPRSHRGSPPAITAPSSSSPVTEPTVPVVQGHDTPPGFIYVDTPVASRGIPGANIPITSTNPLDVARELATPKRTSAPVGVPIIAAPVVQPISTTAAPITIQHELPDVIKKARRGYVISGIKYADMLVPRTKLALGMDYFQAVEWAKLVVGTRSIF
eukprot:TRINITY_DN7599_c0_g1_i4.p1 TRINITY_DN7599_c0_g1~~TRINITY_DN7599_c0_g1_i4.p1  ORF type:complete len:267 (-),score=27.95 TRINITY_DN7599_c0_g1_i4:177-977(-)